MQYLTQPILGLLPRQRAALSFSSLNISMKTYCRNVFAALFYELMPCKCSLTLPC